MPPANFDFAPIFAALNGFTKGAMDNVYVLKDIGFSLLAGIATMILIWTTLKTLLEGGSPRKMFAHAIFVGMMASFAVFMIKELPRVVDIVEASTDQIISTVNPGMAPTAKGDQASKLALQAVSPFFDIAYGIFSSEAPEVKKKPDGTYEAPKDNPGTMSLFALIADFSTGMVMLLFSWALKFMVVGTLIIAACIAIGHFLVSQILIYIAIMIAPLFIPFMVWEAASFMFDGWMKFFIKAVFHKIVGVIMLTIMATGIKAAFLAIETAGGISSFGHGQEFRLTGLMAIMALAILAVFMVNQIPTIADGLISGMARTGISFSPGSPKGTGLKKPPEKKDTPQPTPTPSPAPKPSPSPSKGAGNGGAGVSANPDKQSFNEVKSSSFNGAISNSSGNGGSFGNGSPPALGSGSSSGPTT